MAVPEICFIQSSVIGQKLHTMIWGVEAPRAVLQISHGMAEHIARYDDFAQFLNEHGIAVIGASHLGHGLTAKDEASLGFIARRNGWEHMVKDMQLVREYAEEKYPGVPYFLLGHSMGSFLARTYITKPFAKGLSGAVISGTANQPGAVVSAGAFLGKILRLFQGKRHRSKALNALSFGAYNNAFKPTRTEFDWLSRNEENVDKYISDPFCGFCFTISAFGDLFDGLKYINKFKKIKKIDKKLPCLFISGDKDPVGANGKGVKKVAERFAEAGIEDVRMKLYPDARHEVLNEINRSEVYGDVLSFINRVLG